jgi:hypothetical protein
MKKHYFVFIITILCCAFVCSNSVHAQMTKDGVKIRIFTKNVKGKSSEIKDISSILESGLTCCTGLEEFDRIEVSGNNASISIMVKDLSASEEGDIVYLNKGYYLEKKATFKPFEGREGFGRFTVYIMKDDVTLLQFEYEFLSCT